MKFRYRHLGGGGILFDMVTWQTHLLTPAAAVIVEALIEHAGVDVLDRDAARAVLTTELGVAVHSPEVEQIFDLLADLDVIAS